MEHQQDPMEGIPIEDITLENICGTKETAPVSYWAPRKEEIQRFVEIAKAVHTGEGRPKILDVGCGTGFLAYLLAETDEVDVIGLEPKESSVKESPYSHPNLQLEIGDSKDAVERYCTQDIDIVLNSWMPNGLNLTPDIRNIGAKVIIYIKERGSTGVPDCEYKEFIYEDGVGEFDVGAKEHRRPNPVSQEDGISYHPGETYQRVFDWSGPSMAEVLYLARKLKHPNAFGGWEINKNHVDIQIRRDVPIPEIPKIVISDSDKYAWEADLERFKGPVSIMNIYEEW